MKDNISFIQKDGNFTIEFENGKIKRGSAEQSFALHNLLCFGRLNKTLIPRGSFGGGWAGSIAYVKEFFSPAWSYYKEGNFTTTELRGIINEFNKACDRDYRAGLIQNKIIINKIYKLDKTTMVINLGLDNGETEITIKL